MTFNRLPAAALLGAALAAGCGGDAPPQRTPPPDAKRVDASKAGRITGRVIVEGSLAENPIIKIDDAVCARENKDGLPIETLVVENGGLNNVFVHIRDDLGHYYFETPTEPAKLDQRGCRYIPHVMGVRTGQPLEISNSDPTLHNVSAVAKVNRGFNFGQPMQGIKNTTTFNQPEVMVRLRCDVHGWMTAYVGVVPHPYFSITEGGGVFDLKNVPPGTYTVEAWHEKLGTQAQTVTLGDNASKELNFTFKAQTITP
jgi:hypothetical protein